MYFSVGFSSRYLLLIFILYIYVLLLPFFALIVVVINFTTPS